MIVKSFLIFIVLSFIGNYRDGQVCFANHMSFEASHLEKYNTECYIAINNYIFIQTEEGLLKQKWDILTTYYYFVRVYYKSDNCLMDKIHKHIWIIFKLLNGLPELEIICDKNKISNAYNDIISIIKKLSIGDTTQLINSEVKESYDNCRRTMDTIHLQAFNKGFQLYWIIALYARGVQIQEEGNVGTSEYYRLPVTIDYGYIFLLVKEDDVGGYFEFPPEKQKLFIIDLMCEALIDLYKTIIEVYNKYDSVDDIPLLMISMLNEMHYELIITTKSVFGIQEDRTRYPELKKNIKCGSNSNAVEKPTVKREHRKRKSENISGSTKGNSELSKTGEKRERKSENISSSSTGNLELSKTEREKEIKKELMMSYRMFKNSIKDLKLTEHDVPASSVIDTEHDVPASSVIDTDLKLTEHDVPASSVIDTERETDIGDSDYPKNCTELIRQYTNYTNIIKAIRNKEQKGKTEFIYNYSGRLVTHGENLSVRIPMLEYHLKKTMPPNNILSIKYSSLLMDLFVWTIMIRKFADKMKVDITQKKLPYFEEMMNKFIEHEDYFKNVYK